MEGFSSCECDGRTFRPLGCGREVPTSCAKCHSTAGYEDFLGADGSEAGKVDKAVAVPPNPGVQCEACHNDKTLHMASVTFPSGAVIENPGP